jgi:diguanylate cyclase (GGDEF)-like protein/PAS domain S-box-containing protein
MIPAGGYADGSRVRALVIALTAATIVSLWVIGAKTIDEYGKAQRAVESNVLEAVATAGTHVKAEVRQLKMKLARQWAAHIAWDLHTYILQHPGKTIRELQEDPVFAANAVINIGDRGYAYVYEQKSGIIRLHPDPTLVDQPADCCGFTAHPDTAGQYRGATVRVPARTADGKGLMVCVTAPDGECLQQTGAMTSCLLDMSAQIDRTFSAVSSGARRTLTVSLCVLGGSVALLLTVGAWLLLRNEQILCASANWHRSLVDQALVGMFVYRDGRFRFLNRRIAEIFGYQPKELLGQQVLTVIHRDHRQMAARLIQMGETGERVLTRHELKFMTKQGETGWVDLSLSAMPEGPERCVMVSAVDITERKQVEERLRQRLAVEEAVAKISKELLSPEGADLDSTLQTLGEAMEVSHACICLREASGRMNTIHEWCRKGVPSEMDRLQILEISLLPWSTKMLLGGENIIVADVDAMPDEAVAEQALYRQRNIRSLVRVPIFSAGAGVIGFIGFDDTDECRHWHAEDVQALRLVAEILGSHWDRERAEAALLERQEMLDAVTTLSADTTFVMDEDGRYVEAFSHTHKVMGSPVHQVVGRLMDEVLPMDLAAQLLATIRETVESNARQSTEYQLAIEGQPRWFEGRTAVMSAAPDEKALVILTCRDITPQKENEHRRQLSERKFRAFTEQSLHPVWVVQGQEIVYSNSAMSMQLGLDCRDAVTGMDLEDMVSEKMWPSIAERLASLMAGETEAERMQVNFSRLLGSDLWHDVQFARIEYDGAPAVLATSQDITEIKALMEELNAERLHDSLTGLYNRRYFNDVAAREVERSNRDGLPISLLMLDIDGFKVVNDTYGHRTGDEILRAVAAVLLKDVRGADVPIRFGGDEFLVIMYNTTTTAAEATALRLADGLIEYLHQRIVSGELPDSVASLVWLSGGAATHEPGSTQSLDDVLFLADQRMYAQKERNQRRRDRGGKPSGRQRRAS